MIIAVSVAAIMFWGTLIGVFRLSEALINSDTLTNWSDRYLPDWLCASVALTSPIIAAVAFTGIAKFL